MAETEICDDCGEYLYDCRCSPPSELERLAAIGREWESNNALEKWFPLTAERIAVLERDLAAAQARVKRLEEATRLAELARVELAALTASPANPDFTTACPNIADSTCVHKAYIDLQYARAALAEGDANE